MLLEFTYKEGRGRVALNLDEILPCSAADMKRIFSFIDLSADPWKHAETIHGYIVGKVSGLKEERNQHDENSAIGKERITKINAVLKRYLSDAAALSKSYGLPELSDETAQIVLHSATVYAGIYNSSTRPDHSGWTAESFKGWTFEKGGFIFDVYRKDKGNYEILLHGTGAAVAHSSNKSSAPAEVTPRLLEILRKSSDKIQEAKKRFDSYMVAAGFMEGETETAETISNNEIAEPAETISGPEPIEDKKEVKKMSDYSFTGNTVTCKGITFPAEYNITESGTVLLFVIVGEKPDGRKEKQRVCFNPDHPDHAAALEAAKEYKAGSAKQAKTILNGCKKVATPAGNVIEKAAAPDPAPASIQQEKQPAPARDPKQARGPVPKKTFVGETIQGNGWRIFFDGETARTRVIFDEVPTAAARAAVENAGFYYSGKMKSWNKKLTFKAYRAAQVLAGELSRICKKHAA